MNQNDDILQSYIDQLYVFRSNIPANLTIKRVKEVWSVDKEQTEIPLLIEPRKKIIDNKIKIAKKSLEWLILKPFVKFIAISGSVASKFTKDEDDIDLFIVVKNDTVWIYRLYIYIKNLSKHKIRSKEDTKKGKSVKDKLCINFLVEQRALLFNDDIFNLNELLYMIPIHNKNFQKAIFLNNSWLKDKYMVSEKFLGKDKLKVGDVKELTKRNYFLCPINLLSFMAQLLFMTVMRHKPDFKRLWKGFKNGRVEFYSKDFKREKIGKVKYS